MLLLGPGQLKPISASHRRMAMCSKGGGLRIDSGRLFVKYGQRSLIHRRNMGRCGCGGYEFAHRTSSQYARRRFRACSHALCPSDFGLSGLRSRVGPDRFPSKCATKCKGHARHFRVDREISCSESGSRCAAGIAQYPEPRGLRDDRCVGIHDYEPLLAKQGDHPAKQDSAVRHERPDRVETRRRAFRYRTPVMDRVGRP